MIAWLWIACATPDPTDSAGEDTAADACVDAPVASYESFGAGFLTESCQTCHAGTAPDRHGAPESVTFDTVEEAWAHADRILATTVGDSPTMPPQGGLTEADKTMVWAWLACGDEGS